jgi:hypothetical protein
MERYIKSTFEVLKNIRLQLLIGVLGFYITALILSTQSGDVFLLLWLIIGAFTLYFIRLTFPDVWNYIFWLIGIFFLNFLAVICFLDTKYTSHFLFMAFGIFLELGALSIAVLLILHIKAIRDDISGVTERPTGMELEKEAAYIPLGLWSLALFLFWFISNISIMYWFQWSVQNSGPEAYIFTQVILVFIVVYVLWHPQMRFEWRVESVLGPADKPEQELDTGTKLPSILPKIKKTVSAKPKIPKKCPICGSKIVMENRQCRDCGEKRLFTWCKISEGYIVTCPSCRAQTSYGKDRCVNCGKLIDRFVECNCGTKHEIRDWDFLSLAG